jgi:queuine tRNA-ribosyltransferase
VKTPAFMPVGTHASVKALAPAELTASEAQCVLANTYHLWQRPGSDVIRKAGGIHNFMGWHGPILTDSGGFQVLSLRDLCRISEAGATFRSRLDASERTLTPELAIAVQAALSSDIAMVLDVCPPYGCGEAETREASDRTLRWARRSLSSPRSPGQLVFGIVQGGTNTDLRRDAAGILATMEFDGYGIGGLSIGEQRAETWPALDAALASLPSDRPRYLMGVGAPADIVGAIARGIDLFDSVLPTRLGRNGTVFTRSGTINLRAPASAGLMTPIQPDCDCPACRGFSVGYLHHLIRAGEDLGMRLASLHNVRFLIRLAREARRAIIRDEYPPVDAATGDRPIAMVLSGTGDS